MMGMMRILISPRLDPALSARDRDHYLRIMIVMGRRVYCNDYYQGLQQSA